MNVQNNMVSKVDLPLLPVCDSNDGFFTRQEAPNMG